MDSWWRRSDKDAVILRSQTCHRLDVRVLPCLPAICRPHVVDENQADNIYKAWTPTAIIRTITQTLIPGSIRKLGEIASTYDVATSSAPAEGLDWLPPLLGSSDDTAVAALDLEEEEDDFESDSEEEEATPQSPGLITTDIASLLSQLRTLTTRLASLESTAGVVPNKPVATSWVKTLLAGESATTALASAGGAVGAATIVAILAVWGRGKR